MRTRERDADRDRRLREATAHLPGYVATPRNTRVVEGNGVGFWDMYEDVKDLAVYRDGAGSILVYVEMDGLAVTRELTAEQALRMSETLGRLSSLSRS